MGSSSRGLDDRLRLDGRRWIVIGDCTQGSPSHSTHPLNRVPHALISAWAAFSIAIAGCGIGLPFASATIRPSRSMRACASRIRDTWVQYASRSGPTIQSGFEWAATVASHTSRAAADR